MTVVIQAVLLKFDARGTDAIPNHHLRGAIAARLQRIKSRIS